MRARLTLLFTVAALLAQKNPATPSGETLTSVTLRVPATSNPYLAGMPGGTRSTAGDRAPEQSPVLVGRSLRDAIEVSFAASGGVQNHPYDPPRYDPPDGSTATNHRAEHGISEVTAPIDSLIGVFLNDDRPDGSPAPQPLDFHAIGWHFVSLSPQLKQVFFIGDGTTGARVAGTNKKARVARRFVVPRGATRLFLATMDEYEWNNNTGFFDVAVTIKRTTVDSSISFAKWACLSNRTLCTPEREIVEPRGPNQYHIVLPAQLEWGASIPNSEGATVTVHGAAGIVCLDSQSRGTGGCNGPQGNGRRAGEDFLAPDEGAGALVSKTVGGRTYFSVNDRDGVAFQNHEGYFEFDVTVK